MKNNKLKTILSKFALFLLLFTICTNGVQINYSQENTNSVNNNGIKQKNLPLENTLATEVNKQNDDSSKEKRVIVNTSVELVEDDTCECAFIATSSGGFPLYGFFAIGGIAFVPIALNTFDDKPPTGPNNVVSPSRP